jgi:hypothetical protein
MLNPHYIVGLVDGEGTFHVRINTHQQRLATIELKFAVKLRHQDRAVLDALHQSFECGNVYIQRDKRPNHTLCYRYEIQRKCEIVEKVIPFFTLYAPLTESKKRDFALFKEIVMLSCLEPIDVERICALKAQMHWGLAAYGKTVRAVGTPSNLHR